MSNIFDYIDWRGDLSFNASSFNEIDNLILSRISYFPFDGLIKEQETITVKEAYARFNQLDTDNIHMLQKEDADLFPAVAYSNRFGNLYVKNYISERDNQAEKQFSAILSVLLFQQIKTILPIGSWTSGKFFMNVLPPLSSALLYLPY